MNQQPKPNAAWMTARIFLPSAISLALCSIVGVSAMIVHVLAVGVTQGAFFSNFLDGQWAAVYDEHFRAPLNDFLAKTTLNSVLEVVLWGAIGLVVYTLAERFFTSFFEWRDAERSVQLIAPGRVVRHPLERPFYLILVWRVIIGILMAIWLGIMFASARQLLQVEGLAFTDIDTEHFNAYLFSLAIQWALIGHALVVLLRLVARRSRLFGHSHSSGNNDFFQD